MYSKPVVNFVGCNNASKLLRVIPGNSQLIKLGGANYTIASNSHFKIHEVVIAKDIVNAIRHPAKGNKTLSNHDNTKNITLTKVSVLELQ